MLSPEAVYENHCVVEIWMKVASVLEGLEVSIDTVMPGNLPSALLGKVYLLLISYVLPADHDHFHQ